MQDVLTVAINTLIDATLITIAILFALGLPEVWRKAQIKRLPTTTIAATLPPTPPTVTVEDVTPLRVPPVTTIALLPAFIPNTNETIYTADEYALVESILNPRPIDNIVPFRRPSRPVAPLTRAELIALAEKEGIANAKRWTTANLRKRFAA